MNSEEKDRNIALKIQNYVENGSIEVDVRSREKHVPVDVQSRERHVPVDVPSRERHVPHDVQSREEHVAVDKTNSSNRTSSKLTSSDMASSYMTSSSADDVTSLDSDDKDTVEVQGVVVKLRKKVPRSIEPGGGHEALLSRRMKKSLCGRSAEDVSGMNGPLKYLRRKFFVQWIIVPNISHVVFATSL